MNSKGNFDTVDILVYLWNKRKIITIVTVLGAIVSIIVALLLPNYFKAETVIFPTNFISPQTNVLQQNTNQEMDPLLIGDEDDLEKLIQILKSDYITNAIIKKYDLINHYGLSADDPHLNFKLKKIYQSYITFKKTKYQAIVITVIDKNPEYSANIANDICSLVDSVIFKMQKQRAIEEYNAAKKTYLNELNYYNSLEDTLAKYRKLGIYGYYQEVERYAEAYAKGHANNTITPTSEKFFQNKFQLFAKYGAKLSQLIELRKNAAKNLAQMELNVNRCKQSLDNLIPHKYIISKASKPDKKAFPKRSFIVVLSTIGAFAFAIAIALFIDYFNEFKSRIKK